MLTGSPVDASDVVVVVDVVDDVPAVASVVVVVKTPPGTVVEAVSVVEEKFGVGVVGSVVIVVAVAVAVVVVVIVVVIVVGVVVDVVVDVVVVVAVWLESRSVPKGSSSLAGKQALYCQIGAE